MSESPDLDGSGLIGNVLTEAAAQAVDWRLYTFVSPTMWIRPALWCRSKFRRALMLRPSRGHPAEDFVAALHQQPSEPEHGRGRSHTVRASEKTLAIAML